MKKELNIFKMIFNLLKITQLFMLLEVKNLIPQTVSVSMKLLKNLVKVALEKYFLLITSIQEKNVQLKSSKSHLQQILILFLFKQRF